MARTLTISLAVLGGLILLWGAVCVVPDVPMSLRLRSAFKDLDLPPGGEVYRLHVQAPPLIAYDPGEYLSAVLHYGDRDARELSNETSTRLLAQGWEERFPFASPGFHGARDGWSLTIDIGRWKAEGGGCCVVTDDPARPMGMLVGLRPER